MHQQCQQPHSSSAMWKNAHGFTEKRQLSVREKGDLFLKKQHHHDQFTRRHPRKAAKRVTGRSDHDLFILVEQPRAGGNNIQREEYVHHRRSV